MDRVKESFLKSASLPEECKICGVELGLALHKVQRAAGLPDVCISCAQMSEDTSGYIDRHEFGGPL
jgi:hypothetical protein